MTVPRLSPDALRLARWLDSSPRALALTGAGCSTGSGIPAYRDEQGRWQHRQPMTFATFTGTLAARRRYWAGSLGGWRRMSGARPNRAHHALAWLENRGTLHGLVTQNVDGLHQRAGSERVIDLHGRIDMVVCLACKRRCSRASLQRRLVESNPTFGASPPEIRPDGDAAPGDVDLEDFEVPGCEACGGVLKPDVVFFGEGIPRERVDRARAWLAEAQGLVVLGSSLTVFSGYRFVRWARELGLPVAIVSLGRTRADGEVALKLEAEVGGLLGSIVELGDAAAPLPRASEA